MTDRNHRDEIRDEREGLNAAWPAPTRTHGPEPVPEPEPARESAPEPRIGEIPPDAGCEFRPDGRFYRLEPSWLQLARLRGVIGALVFGGILLVPSVLAFFAPQAGGYRKLIVVTWIVVALLLLVRAWLWPRLAYRRYLYRVDATRIQIRRGVLWREALDIPRNRIQHTDVTQDLLERSFELSHLIVHTAGTTNAAVRLDGLRQETAFRIRDELLQVSTDDAV
ncbi:MAG: PH domain-containing protein [Candidatus Eisenbacteria bacterium]